MQPLPQSVVFEKKAENNKSNIVAFGTCSGVPALAVALASTMPVVAIPLALTGLAMSLYELRQETINLTKSQVHKEFEEKDKPSTESQ